MTHPITSPPVNLLLQWMDEAVNKKKSVAHYVARKSAQWGADQELQAVCQLLFSDPSASYTLSEIRAARRPKPPSLKEQALEAQQRLMTGAWRAEDWQLISRALEQLDD